MIFHPKTFFKVKWGYHCQALNTMPRVQWSLFIIVVFIVIIVIIIPGVITIFLMTYSIGPQPQFLSWFCTRVELWQSNCFQWYLAPTHQECFTRTPFIAACLNNSWFEKGSCMLRPSRAQERGFSLFFIQGTKWNIQALEGDPAKGTMFTCIVLWFRTSGTDWLWTHCHHTLSVQS